MREEGKNDNNFEENTYVLYISYAIVLLFFADFMWFDVQTR